MQEGRAGGLRIGVSLSGGGHRASLFGLGVLMYLADAGKNVDVTSISSVSGGSLTNGFVAQQLDYRAVGGEAFQAAMAPFVRQLAHHGTLMRATMSPTHKGLLVFGFLLVNGAWFLPVSLGARLAIFLGAATVWGALGITPLFTTGLAKAYGVFLVVGLLAALLSPWFVDAAPFWRLCIFGAAVLAWASLIAYPRGGVCSQAFKKTLYSPGGAATRLASINGNLDHVFCATELQSAEQVYFSKQFVYGYRFGRGNPSDLPLHVAVQASANLPGAFPPRWLRAARHEFRYMTDECPRPEDRLSPSPPYMVLADGGVYDNMADQWPQGFARRTECWPELASHHQEPEILVVANASAGAEWRTMKRSLIPAIGEFLGLLAVKDVMYDQTTAHRRQGLVARFDRAALQGRGMRGALVHIAQSPFTVLRAFETSNLWPDRAGRATALRAALGDTEDEWEETANANAKVGTVLSALGDEVSAQLLRHGYVLAMANLYVVLGFPLLPVPAPDRFTSLVTPLH